MSDKFWFQCVALLCIGLPLTIIVGVLVLISALLFNFWAGWCWVLGIFLVLLSIPIFLIYFLLGD